MTTVYEAASGADAQIVVDVLRSAGIEARMLSHGLQGIEVLSPLGNVRVDVDPEHVAAAREVLADWESGVPKHEPSAATQQLRRAAARLTPESRLWRGIVAALVGIAIALAAIWLIGLV